MKFQYLDEMENDLRLILLQMANSFAEADGCGLSMVSRRCRNDSGFFSRIRDPQKSFTVRTFDEVMRWFSVNWPEGAEWPEFVPRPPLNAPCIPASDSTAGHSAASSMHPIHETGVEPRSQLPADGIACSGAAGPDHIASSNLQNEGKATARRQAS